jgi:hypothetical protein
MTDKDILSTSNTSLDTLLLQRKQDKISTELDNETVILDMESGVYSGLDSVGTSIWKLLEKEISFSDLRKTLMEKYDVEKDVCEKDTLLFLNELNASKLIIIK